MSARRGKFQSVPFSGGAKSPSVQLPSRSGTRAATEESANLSACRRQPARGGQAGTPPGSVERGARTESSTLTASARTSGASPRVRSVRRGGRGGGGSEQRLAAARAQRLFRGGREVWTEVRRQSGAHFVNDALRDVAMRLLDHLPGGRTASRPASNLSSCSALHREPPADPLVYGRIAEQVWSSGHRRRRNLRVLQRTPLTSSTVSTVILLSGSGRFQSTPSRRIVNKPL